MTDKKKLPIKQIISYLVSIICLVLCIFVTVEVIDSTRNSRPPRIFGLSVSYVPTGSMEPTIMTGDYVMYKKTTFNKVNENDIIVYYSKTNDRYIIHRVIEKNEDYLITKGDNNELSDTEHITPDMVYGKYIMTIKLLSVFTGGVQKNLIYFILILIFIIMIIMQIVSMVIKTKTEEINNKREEDKKLMLEQLKKEILEEELKKLKEQKKNKE